MTRPQQSLLGALAQGAILYKPRLSGRKYFLAFPQSTDTPCFISFELVSELIEAEYVEAVPATGIHDQFYHITDLGRKQAKPADEPAQTQ